ncbi:MAG: bifunctional hydroxymethylpyrimidine kinase/phosphomethylpyrimidine kinase [Acutalibacteraceae bacterium]|nr:bifunctional hydroxymethylpyrimidine kinase/phosphomethylpyrimidine kinase [Acutalibacteraceae bacterium]
MLKGAIFDFDGTLVDSMFIWDSFGEEYLRSLGKEPKENLRKTFATFTLEQAAEYYRQHYGITLSVEEIVSNVNKIVLQSYRTKVRLKSGVADFLEKLKNQGVNMCVATVTDRFIVEDVLERLGVRKYFSEIFTCSEVGCSKESPEIYNVALQFLKTDKKDTVVFEDSFYALITAKNDGFCVAGVFDKHEKNQVQMKANADYYISDYKHFNFTRQIKTALTIAGSDSSGGAGIQADIKTMTMNGVYAMSAVTALTAQNTMGVRAIQESSTDFLREQIDSVFEDIYPNAVKFGMVSSSKLIMVISERLKHYKAKNIVIDPVMVATSGSPLMKDNAIHTLTAELLPIATLVTPNIPEAEILSGQYIKTKEDMITAAKRIGDNYNCSVLLKGGHSVSDANDLFYSNGEMLWFECKRINNPNTHGTGCTLSSAIASNLAKGFTLTESVKRAKEYISKALSTQLDLGQGSGPMQHNFELNTCYAEKISE